MTRQTTFFFNYTVYVNGVVKDENGNVKYTGKDFSNALNWAVDQPNSIIYIPEGDYTVKGAVTPVNEVLVIGDKDKTNLTFSPDTVFQNIRVLVRDVNNVSFKNLNIHYGSIWFSARNADISNFTVENVNFYNTSGIIDGSLRFHAEGTGTTARKIDNIKVLNCNGLDTNCIPFILAGSVNDSTTPTMAGYITNILFENCTAKNSGINEGRFNHYVCGFDFNEGINIKNLTVRNCIAINNWMDGFHHEGNPDYFNVVYENCISNDNGIVRGGGYGYLYRPKVGEHEVKFSNCTGTGNKSGLTLYGDSLN